MYREKFSEVELAKPIVAWLQLAGWEVYQEVQIRDRFGHGGKIADIVAVRRGIVWVVETKTALGMAVLNQALHWRRYAHYLSVGVPYGQYANNEVLSCVMRDQGLGLLMVRSKLYGITDEHGAFERLAQQVKLERYGDARLRRRIDDTLRRSLQEKQKQSMAGSVSGGHWTPYKATCEELLKMVRRYPGIALMTAIRGGVFKGETVYGLKHHYLSESTAMGSLRTWLDKGLVPGVQLLREGRRLHLVEGGKDVGTSV